MEDDKKVNKVRAEAFDAYERVRPVLGEYFDSWVLTGHRAGCKTKVVLANIDSCSSDMNHQLKNAQEWKKIPVADTQ